MTDLEKHLRANRSWDLGFFFLTMFVDFAAIAFSMAAAFLLYFGFDFEEFGHYMRMLFYFCPMTYFAFKYFRLYDSRRFLGEAREFLDILLSWVWVWIFFCPYLVLTKSGQNYSRWIMLMFFLLTVVAVLLGRFVLMWVRSRVRQRGYDARKLLVIGDGDIAERLRSVLAVTHGHGYVVAGYVCDDRYPEERMVQDGVFYAYEDIEHLLDSAAATEIFITNQSYSADRIMDILEKARQYELVVRACSPIFEVVSSRVNWKHDGLRGVPIVDFGTGHLSFWRLFIKFLVDKICSFLAIVLGMPVWILIGWRIRRDSKGPVFFRQERIGENEKRFTLYKFRTMCEDAETRQKELEHLNISEGVLFKVEEDPRVTKIGGFLRRFSIDEFPQMINVFLGEMSLVGPRPLPIRDYERYTKPWHRKRHEGKPGLTCLWQVSGRNEIDFDEMCILDIFYLRNRSLFLDYRIIVRTFYVVFFAKGVV